MLGVGLKRHIDPSTAISTFLRSGTGKLLRDTTKVIQSSLARRGIGSAQPRSRRLASRSAARLKFCSTRFEIRRNCGAIAMYRFCDRLSIAATVAYNGDVENKPSHHRGPVTMRFKTFAIFFVCLAGAPAVTPAVDLLGVYDKAVLTNPTLRAAQDQLQATRENKPQARALLLPNFNVTGSVQYQNIRTDGVSQFGRFGYNDTFAQQQISAAVTQPLYNRGNWIRLQQTDNTIAQAEAQFRDAQITLMVNATTAYFGVLEAADAVRVQEALVKANERQLEQSKQRFEVGLVAITDVNDSQAAYDSSRATLINAQNALTNAWEALRRVVGPINVPLARLGDKLPLTPPEPNDIKKWTETALHNNYLILADQQAAEAAKKQIQIERSGHYPTFDVQAGYSGSWANAEFNTNTNGPFIGLTMTLPIYQGGAVNSRTRQSGYQYQAALEQLDAQRRSVLQTVTDAFRGIISSISDVKARQAAVISARTSLESTQAGLEVGTRTQVDVLNAQQKLFQAEFEYLSARYNYIINGVKLHQATSTLTRNVLAKGNAWLNPKDTVPPPPY
jgi:outer membrane protein